MITWPHEGTDWAPMLKDITRTYIELATAINRYEKVIIIGRPTQTIPNSIVIDAPCNDTWARDYGPLTMLDGDGLHLLDFAFNGWGKKFPAEKDNAINKQLYDSGAVAGEYEDHLDFVLEGGSVESDGQGTIFTTTHCLTAPNRNNLSRSEIETELKHRLRAERVVWIDHGSLRGDDTDGHIDTLMRVAPNDTILYTRCDDTTDEQYDELHLMEEQIKGLTTTMGKPYTLLPVPLPDAIYDGDDRLPATYANYLVINGAVIVPTYAQEAKDQTAMRTIAQAFPNRDIIPIDSRTIIRQHGSVHCCTMQIYEDRNNTTKEC